MEETLGPICILGIIIKSFIVFFEDWFRLFLFLVKKIVLGEIFSKGFPQKC